MPDTLVVSHSSYSVCASAQYHWIDWSSFHLFFSHCARCCYCYVWVVCTANSNSDHHCSDLVCQAVCCFSSESLSFLFGLIICSIPLVGLKLISSLLFALCTLFLQHFFPLSKWLINRAKEDALRCPLKYGNKELEKELRLKIKASSSDAKELD